VIHRASVRLAGGLLAALSILFAMVVPVAAHVTIVDGSSVPAGGSAVIYFRLPHGCDGQPVNALSVQLPDGIVGAKPEAISGWTTTTEMVPAQYELFGTQYTERVGTIRWEGGPVKDAEFLDFGVRATFQMEPGTYPIPVVQECGADSVAWIEVPAEGQSEDDLEAPAPTITVVAAEEGDGHDHGAAPSDDHATGEEAAADMTKLSADVTAVNDKVTAELASVNERLAAIEAEPASDTSSQTLMIVAVAALIAGVGGLILGAVALRRGRPGSPS
jgi:uncharacterized protein YcnI